MRPNCSTIYRLPFSLSKTFGCSVTSGVHLLSCLKFVIVMVQVWLEKHLAYGPEAHKVSPLKFLLPGCLQALSSSRFWW